MDVEDADAFILILKVVKIILFQFRGKIFKFRSLHSLSVIRNGNEEILFSGLHAEKDASAGRDSIESVFDAVLYKRLETSFIMWQSRQLSSISVWKVNLLPKRMLWI